MSFKTKKTFIERKTESFNIMNRYPDRIPIICEKNAKCKNAHEIDKIKYLVPNDLTVGHFMYVIRKRIKLNPDQGIFLFINNSIPSTTILLSFLYSIYKEDDGFLYITYSTENTFG